MNAILKLENGKEIAVEVSEETLKQIEQPVKKTGYEFVEADKIHYIVQGDSTMCNTRSNTVYDEGAYQVANYYSDKTVAENNARVDTLMRKLRRFAVEHRDKGCCWVNYLNEKYFIVYDYIDKELSVEFDAAFRGFGVTYFDSEETAKAAIEEFKDELLWYFTEYKDSL